MIDTNEIRAAFIKPYNGNPEDAEIIAEEMVISDLCNEIDRLRDALDQVTKCNTLDGAIEIADEALKGASTHE